MHTHVYTCIIWWQSMTHSYLIFLSCEHFDVVNSLPAKDRKCENKNTIFANAAEVYLSDENSHFLLLLFMSTTPTGAVGGCNGRKSWELPKNCHNLIKADKKWQQSPLGDESKGNFFNSFGLFVCFYSITLQQSIIQTNYLIIISSITRKSK